MCYTYDIVDMCEMRCNDIYIGKFKDKFEDISFQIELFLVVTNHGDLLITIIKNNMNLKLILVRNSYEALSSNKFKGVVLVNPKT